MGEKKEKKLMSLSEIYELIKERKFDSAYDALYNIVMNIKDKPFQLKNFFNDIDHSKLEAYCLFSLWHLIRCDEKLKRSPYTQEFQRQAANIVENSEPQEKSFASVQIV